MMTDRNKKFAEYKSLLGIKHEQKCKTREHVLFNFNTDFLSKIINLVSNGMKNLFYDILISKNHKQKMLNEKIVFSFHRNAIEYI